MLLLVLLGALGMAAGSGTSEAPLLLMDRTFAADFEGGEFTIHSSPVLVREVEGKEALGTGGSVWSAGPMLAKHLEHEYAEGLVGRHVLELGAGTGLVGMAAGLLGARLVHLTDIADVCAEMQTNVALNAFPEGCEVRVEELDWRTRDFSFLDTQPPLDVILAADVVWVRELIAPLAETLAALTSSYATSDEKLGPKGTTGVAGVGPLILFAHQTRALSSDELFFKAVDKLFHRAPVPQEKLHPAYRDPKITIFEMRRKPVAQDL